jgi:hypothetical protein
VPQLDARLSSPRLGGSVEEDVSFALPPSPSDRTSNSSATSDDAMRCRRVSSTLASGFYSVGVGAPRAHGGPAAVSASLPPSLRFLEHLSIDMFVVPDGGSVARQQFALTVHHNKTKASWRHCHSYDDYRALQERLLALMEQGHFCMAECPWLYTFLRRSFPKPPPALSLFGLLGQHEKKAADERRVALLRTLTTLQSVVLNPQNHSCEVLTHGVATELVAFLYGDEKATSKSPAARSPSAVRPWEVASPVAGTTRGFSVSSARLSEDDHHHEDESASDDTAETEESSSEPAVCCSMCALQAEHPEEEILVDWHKPPQTTTKAKLSPAKETTRPTTFRNRSSSSATLMLSQFIETPTDYLSIPQTPPGTPPPLVPENAILSPPRHYHMKKTESRRPSKRFSLHASTLSVFHSLRQRVISPSVQGSYAA